MQCVRLAWAIRKKGTELYLPARKSGRGHSYSEPEECKGEVFPRLFRNQETAWRALRAWAQGRWEIGWNHNVPLSQVPHLSFHSPINYAQNTVSVQTMIRTPVPGRDLNDMEIVQINLSVYG